ncbi:type IV toxin-antitoxin system AbiEi family antitoxin domain-containing protein [Desulfonatronum thioautotrophicum]|uniref:type IV toxin-antitoxin system AbiEi family antitoxin domain-containing protein n=1 Tax=Desulfonatronum thioautotrophicum TaxID=617001 RepID=UPI0005EB4323|nr:hypothetical protein [Desulfonatronum thioautotrophicum]
MQNDLVDLPDALWLQGHFAEYANPKAVVARLTRQGGLHRLKRGLYINARRAHEPDVAGKAANRLYGPSYVSFVYALRWYGLIPEHVVHVTSATFAKGRKKRFDTPIGSFFYQDIPANAYPFGIRFVGRGRDRYLMASPEKAICDELYRVAGIRSIQRMQDLLFEDLRLDRERFMELDRQDLLSLSGRYSATSLDTFARFVRRQS